MAEQSFPHHTADIVTSSAVNWERIPLTFALSLLLKSTITSGIIAAISSTGLRMGQFKQT